MLPDVYHKTKLHLLNQLFYICLAAFQKKCQRTMKEQTQVEFLKIEHKT